MKATIDMDGLYFKPLTDQEEKDLKRELWERVKAWEDALEDLRGPCECGSEDVYKCGLRRICAKCGGTTNGKI
jgi:hypothetical protein